MPNHKGWLLSVVEVLISCRVTALYPRPKGARFYGEFDKGMLNFIHIMFDKSQKMQINQQGNMPISHVCITFDNLQASDPRLLSGYIQQELGELFAQYLVALRYQVGELSLGEVAEVLGFYPDIAKAKAWLNAQGVVQAYTPSERAHLQQSFAEISQQLANKRRLSES